MRQLTGNQKAHRNEVLGRAVTTRLGFSRLNQRIDRLHIAVVQESGLKRLHNPQPMRFDRFGQILDRIQPRTLSPVQPTRNQGSGLNTVSLAFFSLRHPLSFRQLKRRQQLRTKYL